MVASSLFLFTVHTIQSIGKMVPILEKYVSFIILFGKWFNLVCFMALVLHQQLKCCQSCRILFLAHLKLYMRFHFFFFLYFSRSTSFSLGTANPTFAHLYPFQQTNFFCVVQEAAPVIHTQLK